MKNKSGDLSDINNYRAIALSNSLSKVIEKLILIDCFQSCDVYDDNHQFGFKKNNSTSLSCAVLKRVIDYYCMNGSYVFACFLDISKAFDRVNHRSLFSKLRDLKLPSNMVKLLVYWYANQSVNVRWKHIVTGEFLMKNGTRQGSVLSPYLFCVYMRCISHKLSSSGIGCHIGGISVCVLLYADDLVILASSWSAQQQLLNLCVDTVSQLDMKFNGLKSVTMIFKPYKPSRCVSYSFPVFMLDGCMLSMVHSCKYLGHLISSSFDDNAEIQRQMGLLYARTNILIRRFSRCSRDVKLCLFKTYCGNFYGIALWDHFNVTVRRKFEAAYVKCIKMFFGYSRYDSVTGMFAQLGLPTFSTIVHNEKYKLADCARHHANIVVKTVFDICT